MTLTKRPFSRQRPDGTLVSSSKNWLSLGMCLALGTAPFLLSSPILAAPKAAPQIGIQAWTSGAQTYIRARPATNTPPVAKVARHMPLFVWGKYDGWYRVETHDHIFGWVKAEYLNSPDLRKVKPMSQTKAIAATNRTSDQVMFGTPAELRAYHARYGAEGARKGLALYGIYLPANGTSKTKLIAGSKPSNKAPLPSRPEMARVVALPAQDSASSISFSHNSLAPAASERVVASRSLETRVVTAPTVSHVDPMRVTALTPVVAPVSAPKSINTTARAASSPRKLSRWELRRQKRLMAQKAKRERLRAKAGFAAAQKAAMPVVPSPLAVTPLAPISPRDLMKARENYLQERQNRLGRTTPLSPVTNVAPLPSNTDLSSTPAGAQIAPQLVPSALSSAKLAPGSVISVAYPTQSGGQNQNAAPPRISWVDESGKIVSATMPLLPASSSKIAQENLAPINQEILKPFTVSHAQLAPAGKVVAGSRGGSMLDRYRKPGGEFGQNVTKQALSYRGMPYIFGASNPRRGFDCSGLVFHLLRSRGMNPPRTAAGYRNYGKSVGRSELQAGDLVLFANTYKRGISHIGIYMGNNKFVHAASTGKGVRVDSLVTGYFAKKYHSARRVK